MIIIIMMSKIQRMMVMWLLIMMCLEITQSLSKLRRSSPASRTVQLSNSSCETSREQLLVDVPSPV